MHPSQNLAYPNLPKPTSLFQEKDVEEGEGEYLVEISEPEWLPSPSSPRGEVVFDEISTDLPALSHEFDTEAWFENAELKYAEDRLLEVVVRWKGGILDIGHYNTPRRLTFGTDSRADFSYSLDPFPTHPTAQACFPLIEPGGGGFLLSFYPEMEGSVEENGETFSLMELVKEGRAHCFDRLSGLCYYPLTPGTRVHLSFHGIDVHLQFVTSPHFNFPLSRRLDLGYLRMLSLSLATHLFMVCLCLLYPTHDPPQQTISKRFGRYITPDPPQHTPSSPATTSRPILVRDCLQEPNTTRDAILLRACLLGSPLPSSTSGAANSPKLHPKCHDRFRLTPPRPTPPPAKRSPSPGSRPRRLSTLDQ